MTYSWKIKSILTETSDLEYVNVHNHDNTEDNMSKISILIKHLLTELQ